MRCPCCAGKGFLETEKMSTGDLIRLVRRLRGLSQDELAEKLAVTRQHAHNLEANKANVTLPMLRKLAVALDVAVHDLIP